MWALPVLSQDIGFYGAKQIVRIQRCREDVKSGKRSEEISFYITSLAPVLQLPINAEVLLRIARDHWTVENRSHYMRDRTYDEDRCQVRNPTAAQVLATLRNLAGFLASRGAHQPPTRKQKGVPSLHRYAQYHRPSVIRWFLNPDFLAP